MRLNNNKKIITEDDIILSDGEQSLSERFKSQLEEINKLKSNLKWIYKYGGVGSGTGGGGGATLSFSIYATLNNVLLKDLTITLPSLGNYTLFIKINNPNGASFNVQYSYTSPGANGNITLSRTVILSIENNYTFETTLNLQNNDMLTIVASDGNTTLLTFCNYVTTPYLFTTTIVNNNGSSLETIDTNGNRSCEVFVTTAKENGVNIKLSYSISVNAEVSYRYKFQDDELSGTISDKSGEILFPITPDLFTDSNAGYYSIDLKLDVIPENLDPVSIDKSTTFNLIPDSLYLLLSAQDGIIYTEETEDPYLFTPGYLTFNCRVYDGVSNNRTYNILATVDNKEDTKYSATVTERLLNSFKMYVNTGGLHTLNVIVTGGSGIYSCNYYFYTSKSTTNTDWFDPSETWIQSYFRLSERTLNFTDAGFTSRLVEQTVNSLEINVTGIVPPNLSGNAAINTHIAIGVLFSAINNDDAPIIEFFNANNDGASVLAINLLTTQVRGETKLFYIKKQDNANIDETLNYHLILIYSNHVKSADNNSWYETSLYIDGVLESVCSELTNYPLLITDLTIRQSNCYFNLIDVDYKLSNLSDSNNAERIADNLDFQVYKYFLAYKNKIIFEDVTEVLPLTEFLPNFNVGLNGRVSVDYATINNIANNINIPTLLMTYQVNEYEDLMSELEKNYGEDGTGIGNDLSFLVSLQWSPGKTGLLSISFPDGFTNAAFRALLQGSSTKLYRVKNFTLSLENTNDTGGENDVYLYSPNFKNGDTSTFLPETEFTLKADVVDSSHSNNTSCGKFVNTVCRKFSNDINEDGHYSNYIRNCLEGFPFLMYLCIVDIDEETLARTETYYYFGIYNFNLGRSSYYNLGYKDLSVFGNGIDSLITDAGNAFSFFKITSSLNILREGLGVAEILGGSNYFDFSLYDSSILFEQQLSGTLTDNTYMFGDLVYGSNEQLSELLTYISTFVQKVALGGGYLFDYIKKKRGSYDAGYKAEKYVDGAPTGESLNLVPDYTHLYKRVMKLGSWTYEEKETISPGTYENLNELVVTDSTAGTFSYINYLSLAEYYTICMVLGLVDSVLKNLNIKTWNNRTWYLAFYDMDTCLGINNQGNDINYFAFSDYWHSQYTTKGDTDYPSNAIVYRDFSPMSMGENGYDIPSSYLFAVAKYARLAYDAGNLTDDQAAALSIFPQELYAKWRSNTINLDTNEGILKNADYFMENFFSNNLGSICPALVSFNYRSKYLALADNGNATTWNNTDFNKFNGTRINKVRDWLNGRLHILDVYFNLNKDFINTIQYLNEENKWVDLTVGSSNTPVSDITYVTTTYDVASNPDVVILHDIFSSGTTSTGLQLSGSVNIKIKCPEYSPLLIYNANSTIKMNYILGGDNYLNIAFETTGVLGVKIGGSLAWTYLESINWLSVQNLYIGSDYLENITGSLGSFTAITLNTPNVKTIDLTSPNYSGQLSLLGTSNYPNLTSINISGSKLALDVRDLAITSINISNLKSNDNRGINIQGCDYLKSFSCNNTTANSLTISNINDNLKNLSISGTNIGTMSFSCDVPGGTLSISNDNTLTSLTVSGFETITVNNCPKLTKISFTANIAQGDNNIPVYTEKVINITKCTANNLSVTSTGTFTNGTVNLTKSNRLTLVNFNGSYPIKAIYLPANVTLPTSACYNLYNLTSIDGTNIILYGNSIFRNCYQYALRNSKGLYTDFHINPTLLNASSMFYMSSRLGTLITRDDIKHFILTAVPSSNSMTNISYMFANNSGVVYGETEFVSDLKSGTSNYIDMSKFNKVTNADNCFYLCNITAYHKNMFNFGGSTLHLNGFCDPYEVDYIRTTLDLFDNIITKLNYLLIFSSNKRNPILFYDNNGEVITEEILLKDFFNPGGKSPSKLITLGRIFLANLQIVDLTGTFNSSWTSLTSISEFLWRSDLKYKGVDNLFKELPKITTLVDVLLPSQLDEARANLFTVLNWESFLKRSGRSFAGCASDSYNTGSFTFHKYISSTDYNTLCNLLLSSNIEDISFLFLNCNIVDYLGDFSFGNSTSINSTIKKFKAVYKNCKFVTADQTSSHALPLSHNFFKVLTAITDVRLAFLGCSFSNYLPYDFFNKRLIDLTINRNVYIKEEEEYKEATLYVYTYRQEMTCYTQVFNLCSWGKLYFDPADSTIDKARVVCGEDVYYDGTYYTRRAVYGTNGEFDHYEYDAHTLTLPTEITDTENLLGYYLQVVSTGTSTASWNNVAIDSNAVTKLCVPPDIFYGAKANIASADDAPSGRMNYNYAFNCSTRILGIIPLNLFKNNKNGDVSYTFYNLSIVPRLVHSYKEGNNTVNVYTHFPSGYTNFTNLNGAFTCAAVVPLNVTVGENTTYNYVFMILNTTIPKGVTSLQDAFNFTSYESGLGWFGGLSKEDINYINYVGTIGSNSVTTGLDVTYFTSLNMDNLFYSIINRLGSGYFFNSTFNAVNIKLSNSNNKVISSPGLDNVTGFWSLFMLFPQATGDISRLLNVLVNTNLKSSLVLNFTTSALYYRNVGIRFSDVDS